VTPLPVTRIPNCTMRFSSTVLKGCRYEAPGVARPFASTATGVFNEVMFSRLNMLFTSAMNFGLMHSQMTAKLRGVAPRRTGRCWVRGPCPVR